MFHLLFIIKQLKMHTLEAHVTYAGSTRDTSNYKFALNDLEIEVFFYIFSPIIFCLTSSDKYFSYMYMHNWRG
jgi:hypothetical protein